MQQVKILLVQLASNGDCLFVTAIAKQIKEIDFPGCHLSWLIGSKYKEVLLNNHYVDEIIEIPISNSEEIIEQRSIIDKHVLNLKSEQGFDKVFVTDYYPPNYQNWYGTTRSSLFRNYPLPIKVNPQPVVFLTGTEINNVVSFCKKNSISNQSINILFECSPQSTQSKMTYERAKEISERLVQENKNLKIILSSNNTFESQNPNIIDGSQISFRENAELVNYCDFFIGSSSGISWLSTSSWSKRIPTIQVINPDYFGGLISASMKADFEYFGISRKKLIELHNPSDDFLIDCISGIISGNFQKVKRQYEVVKNNCYQNYRFLIESKIPLVRKVMLLKEYHSFNIVRGTYLSLKPAWFTPRIWVNRIKNG